MALIAASMAAAHNDPHSGVQALSPEEIQSWIGRDVEGRYKILPFYLVAVLMHGTYNFIASLQNFFEGEVMGVSFAFIALFMAIVFAVSAITLVRLKIMKIYMEPGPI